MYLFHVRGTNKVRTYFFRFTFAFYSFHERETNVSYYANILLPSTLLQIFKEIFLKNKVYNKTYMQTAINIFFRLSLSINTLSSKL